MYNNLENRDINLETDNENEKNKRKGIWILILYILALFMILIGVYITSSNFLRATIKPNEIIIDGDDGTDDDGNVDNNGNNSNNVNGSTVNQNNNKDNNLKIKVSFDNQDDTKLRMKYEYPVSDDRATNPDSTTDFTFENLGNTASYKISLRDADDANLEKEYNNKRIKHQYLKFYLKNHNTNQEYTGYLTQLDVLESYICSGTINKGEKIKYSLAVWVDKNAGNEVQDSFYIGKLYVDIEGE